MKKLIGIAFIIILLLTTEHSLFAEEDIVGFSSATVNPDTDFRTYDILYIEKVNMKDVSLEESALFYDYDDESGGMLEENRELGDLEYKYRMSFGKALSDVIPVTYRKTEEKGKRAMVLLLTIEGDLKETRLLENLMPGGEKREAKVAIEGRLVDQATREELAYFIDEYISVKSTEDESVFDEDDQEEWNKAVNLWAKYITDFLAQKRKELYAFSR